MARSELEIRELLKEWELTLEVSQKDPMKIVKLTGGNIPPMISNIQIMWTAEAANLGINVLKWILGEENGALHIAKTLNQRLKNVE